jgi:hypothetical protein
LARYRGALGAAKIIELLVHRITVTPDGFKIDFYGGSMEIERGLAQAGAPGFHPKEES